jgi:hypothetical protein
MAVVCKHLAHRAPNTIVGVLVETLQHPHYFPVIENRRSIAKYMHRHETNRGIGVGGHLQNPLPDFGNFGFEFAGAERPECLAPLPRVATVSEFKPLGNIALASAHGTNRSLFSNLAGPAVSSNSPPKAIEQNTVFGPRVTASGLNRCHLGGLPAPRRGDSRNEPC